VARVVQHFQQEDVEARKLTMGVVTFNQPQMRLIDQLLQQELLKNPELEERMAAHGDEKLFVKNLENVQGDERSIILFSITYGRDASGRMPMNFGPVNQEGGQRRLNVAVTRARNAIEIYTSVRADEIDLSKTRSKGVADLKAYLEYAVRGARSLAEESMPTGREPDSPFEREVIQVVRDAGWEVHPQVGCSGFRIDMGVVDRGHLGRYLIGIECDGATYHSLATARDRDRLRQSILEGLGWQLTRIWSTDWWNNREGTAEQLLAKVADEQQSADALRKVEAEKDVQENGQCPRQLACRKSAKSPYRGYSEEERRLICSMASQ
jgi:very-short-patch-repair endonuclease